MDRHGSTRFINTAALALALDPLAPVEPEGLEPEPEPLC